MSIYCLLLLRQISVLLKIFAFSTFEIECPINDDIGLNFAIKGDITRSYGFYQHFIQCNLDPSASVLHILGTLEIIFGNFSGGIYLHGAAKSKDPTQQPPLALLYKNDVPCGGLGEVYWTSSHIKKSLFDNDTDSRRFDRHVSLGIVLEDIGLPVVAQTHFRLAQSLQPHDIDLMVHLAQYSPIVHFNTTSINTLRSNSIHQIISITKSCEFNSSYRLHHLDQFNHPAHFFLIYQGHAEGDVEILRLLHDMYKCLYSPSLSSMLPSPSSSNINDIKPLPIKVGVVSNLLSSPSHSICKLFCYLFNDNDDDDDDDYSIDVTTHTTNASSSFINLIISLHYDVIIFPDVGMDPVISYLLTTLFNSNIRLAPIQIQLWGHPSTSGYDGFIDYFISSQDFHFGGNLNVYSEQLVLFDSLGAYFNKGKDDDWVDWRRCREKLIQVDATRESEVLIAVPQFIAKFHPNFDSALFSMISRLAHSRHRMNFRIVFVYELIRSQYVKMIVDRWARHVDTNKQLNIEMSGDLDGEIRVWSLNSSHHSSIVLEWRQIMNHSKFMKLMRDSTFTLDLFPFGGGVTVYESLSSCLPLVTLPMKQWPPIPTIATGISYRMGENNSLIHVARTEEEYVDIASCLAGVGSNCQRAASSAVDPRTRVFEQDDSIQELWDFVARAHRSRLRG